MNLSRHQPSCRFWYLALHNLTGSFISDRSVFYSGYSLVSSQPSFNPENQTASSSMAQSRLGRCVPQCHDGDTAASCFTMGWKHKTLERSCCRDNYCASTFQNALMSFFSTASRLLWLLWPLSYGSAGSVYAQCFL